MPNTQQKLGTMTASAYTGQMVVITSEQIRAARALLRWEQKDLAEASGLALITINAMERRPGPLMMRTSSLYALVAAFDRAGIEFLDADDGGAGVRFKRR
jgi:transcriptional regulator with XRE-family HTH domain